MPAKAETQESMEGHSSMGAMDSKGEQDMPHDRMMRSQFGPYAMTREGSGTSWQPEATPMHGLMWESGEWMLMTHGFANAVYDHQGGPRGDDEAFVNSMAMLMAQRPVLLGKIIQKCNPTDSKLLASAIHTDATRLTQELRHA